MEKIYEGNLEGANLMLYMNTLNSWGGEGNNSYELLEILQSLNLSFHSYDIYTQILSIYKHGKITQSPFLLFSS